MERFLPDIVGQSEVKRRLYERSQALSSSQMALQPFLFVGPEGLGKRTIALQWLLSLGILSPRIMEPEKIEERGRRRIRSMSIGTVREALRDLALSSSGRRALLVDDAHRLSEEAQNAFLKTLEEPPRDTIIILVTHREGALLSTVLSRLERIAFSPVAPMDIRAMYPEAHEDLIRSGLPGVVHRATLGDERVLEATEILVKLCHFSSLSSRDRMEIAARLKEDSILAEEILSRWAGELERRFAEAKMPADRLSLLRLLEAVSTVLRDLERSSSATRWGIEHLFAFGTADHSFLRLPFAQSSSV